MGNHEGAAAATEAAESAVTTTEEAVESAAGSASDAMDAAEDVSTTVADDVATTTGEAAEAVEGAASDAADAVSDTAQSAAEATEAAIENTGAGADQTITPDVLTLDGFDLDGVKDMIDGSDLGAMQKQMLTTAVETAQNSPEMLEQALAQLRSALGY